MEDGTLVRMTGMTNVKREKIAEHGHLWIVVWRVTSGTSRAHVLKSIATGHVYNFNRLGLEASSEEQLS
jgi:hypothetical protein